MVNNDKVQNPPAQVFAVKATTPTGFYVRCSICRTRDEFPEGVKRSAVVSKAIMHNLVYHEYDGGY